MDRQPHPKKFAFLAHPTDLDDLYSSGPPGLSDLSPELRRNWEHWVASWSAHHYEPGVFFHLPSLRSRTGVSTEGWLVGIPLTPKQIMDLKPPQRAKLMQQCIETARKLGAEILGLGAFTSIITRNGLDMVGCGIPVTTGNSLTAIVASESIKALVHRRGGNPATSGVGIIGAAGSVGRLACKNLVTSFGRFTLIGNPNNPKSMQKLRIVAGELYFDAIQRLSDVDPLGLRKAIGRHLTTVDENFGRWDEETRDDTLGELYTFLTQCFQRASVEAPITVSIDIAKDLPQVNYIVSATSNAQEVIKPGMLAPNAIVCDAARPPDISTELARSRPDVITYEGGLVKLPQNLSLGSQNLVGCPPGVNLACLSETMVLALSGKERDYSVGMTTSLDEALEVYELAKLHGFSVYLPPDHRLQ